MDFHELGKSIAELISLSPSFQGQNIFVDIIINPLAGGLRKRRFVRREYALLTERNVQQRRSREGKSVHTVPFNLYITEYAGHAHRITKMLIAKVRGEERYIRHIIITAGGDGTAIEVCSALVEADEVERDRFILFRLPFGTGNDGLDAESPEEAWELLAGETEERKIGYISVHPKNHPPVYAFNIASIGLDGYVTELANRLKRFVPVSFYSLMVNVAALFYDRSVDSLMMELAVRDSEDGWNNSEEYLLLAFGVTGHRSYGGKKRILPTDENVCVVKPMSLFKKFAIKDKFYTGEHVTFKEAKLFHARQLIITCFGSIPMQCDGEVYRLSPDNFPLVMNVEPPLLSVLCKKESRYSASPQKS